MAEGLVMVRERAWKLTRSLTLSFPIRLKAFLNIFKSYSVVLYLLIFFYYYIINSRIQYKIKNIIH